MALPAQEIEKIARSSPSTGQGVYGQLLLLAAALFVISLILYGGLHYGFEPYLNNQVTTLDAKIAQFSRQVSPDDQAKLIAFYSQLVNLKTILERHPSTSAIFDWLEKNTQTNSYFTRASFSGSNYQLILQGNSKSPDDAAEQAAILEAQPEILRLNFNNLTPSAAGGWHFNLTAFLNPKSFVPGGQIPGAIQGAGTLPPPSSATTTTPLSVPPAAATTTTKP